MEALIRCQTQYFSRCQHIIRIFYGILFYVFMDASGLLKILEGDIQFIPVLRFLEYVPSGWMPGLVYASMLPVLLTFFAPQMRSLRIFSAFATFVMMGLYCSVGLRSTSGLVYVWISFFLCFPPNWIKRNSFRTRQKTIFFVWMATASLLLTYVAAGVWKFVYSLVLQPLSGYAGGFSPEAMARIVADYIVRSGQPSWLASYVIDHAFLGGPVLYVYLVLIELTAFLPLFFPKYYRVLAFELLMFHLFSFYILHIAFLYHLPLIILFLYYSPFHQDGLLSQEFLKKRAKSLISRWRERLSD